MVVKHIHLNFICVFLSMISCLSRQTSMAPVYVQTVSNKLHVNHIIHYEGFDVSYDENNLIPCWVSYSLLSDEVLDTPPPTQGGFKQDKKIKLKQADYSDYKGTGWSRGHMAPAADFKWSTTAYEGTYVYTNCCPQDKSFNNGSWNVLENNVRKWAKEYNKILVVTGPIIGENKNGTIGSRKVTIPDQFFKALLIEKDDEYCCVGFIMNNTSDKQTLLNSFVSINRLEQITGYDFFPFLDDEKEDIIEGIVDRTIWHF